MNLPKEYLSISQLNLYRECPEKYRRKYVEEQPACNITNVEGLIVGQAFHRYIKDYFKMKDDYDLFKNEILIKYFYDELIINIKKKRIETLVEENRPLEDFHVRKLLRYYYEEALIENQYNFDYVNEMLSVILTVEDFEKYIKGYTEELKSGTKIRPSLFKIFSNICEYFRDHQAEVTQNIIIEDQELKLFSEFERYGKIFKIQTILDLIGKDETDTVIIDWKSSKRSWNEKDVKRYQDFVYSYVIWKKTGIIPVFKYVVFVYSEKTGNIKLQVFKVQYDIESLSYAEAEIHKCCRGITEGVFYKNEDSWMCSQDYCEYFTDCQRYQAGVKVECLTTIINDVA